MPTIRESHARSIAKAVSWRALGSLATLVIVFAFTHRVRLSIAVGGLELVSKIALYWFHERVWEHVRFGRQDDA